MRADSHRSNSSFLISWFWIWEMSSIRRTRRLRRRLSSEMICRYCRSFSGGMVPSRIPSVYPAMVVMGVFSSWDTLAIKSRRWRSVSCRESAMALKDAASSLISLQSPVSCIRTSKSPAA